MQLLRSVAQNQAQMTLKDQVKLVKAIEQIRSTEDFAERLQAADMQFLFFVYHNLTSLPMNEHLLQDSL